MSTNSEACPVKRERRPSGFDILGGHIFQLSAIFDALTGYRQRKWMLIQRTWMQGRHQRCCISLHIGVIVLLYSCMHRSLRFINIYFLFDHWIGNQFAVVQETRNGTSEIFFKLVARIVCTEQRLAQFSLFANIFRCLSKMWRKYFVCYFLTRHKAF